MASPTHAFLVEFGLFPVQNEEKSAAEGRPIYEDKEYIHIIIPGDKFSEIHRPVETKDKTQYAAEWAAYQAGDPSAIQGTPLSAWPTITTGQVKELAHFNVRSVEQLAGLSDGNIENVGAFRALRQKAKDFLEAAKGNAPLEKMRAELDKRDTEAAEMRRQLKEAMEAIEKLKRNQQHK